MTACSEDSHPNEPQLEIQVGCREGRKRVVRAMLDTEELHRDRVDTDCDQDRRRWLTRITEVVGEEIASTQDLIAEL